MKPSEALAAQRAELAAGFPAIAVEVDATFQAIAQGGKVEGAPELVVTDGIVAALQAASSGLQLLVNTAKIAPGTSGGPLLDRCGRVVRINTFGVATADGLPVAFSYAQKSETLIDFLTSAGLSSSVADGPCPPESPGGR